MASQEKSVHNLENKITVLKNYMINSAFSKGFHHPQTVKISQDLDDYLNQYHFIKTKTV